MSAVKTIDWSALRKDFPVLDQKVRGKPIGTDAQGGGLQSQAAGGHLGNAKSTANEPLMKANQRMKTKNRDEVDANQSLFAVASSRRKHLFSRTTPFAEISFCIDGCFNL